MDSDLSAHFLCANHNKKSIVVYLAGEVQVDGLKKRVAISDVAIENYKRGDLASRGLVYEEMAQIKRDIVWSSMSGFG
ncbi:MAG: CoA transferase [Pseudomonadota bacterium]